MNTSALYYQGSENITDTSLSFKMQTSKWMNRELNEGNNAYQWMKQVYTAWIN